MSEEKLRRFNVPVSCANCGRHISTVSYFATEKREEPKRYCRRPACQAFEAKAMSGPPEDKALAPASLEKKTRNQLTALAKKLGMRGYSKLKVDELRDAVAEEMA